MPLFVSCLMMCMKYTIPSKLSPQIILLTEYCSLESVGCQGKVNNFKTFGAFKCTLVKVFSAVSEAKRIFCYFSLCFNEFKCRKMPGPELRVP